MKQKIENGVLVKFRNYEDGKFVEHTGLWIDNTLTYVESGVGIGTYTVALILAGTKFYECPHERMELLEDTPMTRKA